MAAYVSGDLLTEHAPNEKDIPTIAKERKMVSFRIFIVFFPYSYFSQTIILKKIIKIRNFGIVTELS
ncbi:hypothetical protein AD942_12470 [Gluconobacter japonicus]|nr:hypothetical protein AD942_12470 [Gluconobacter japonicus]KXV42029.1 hypothetical protein AD936_12405 [Gluconobacter japonicus]